MEKKIALDLQPCYGNRSGIGMYTFELAKRLKSDDELTFSGRFFNFRGRRDNTYLTNEMPFPVRECRIFPYRFYRLFWSILPVYYHQFFSEKSDLTVFFNYIVPAHIRGKVITTIYDVTYLRYPETMRRITLYNLRWRMRRSIKRSDHILTISEFVKQELIDLLHIPEEKISVVPCSAVCSDAEADYADVKEKYDLNGPYILYVGTVEPRKNLVRLIHAFELLKNERNIPHRLILAGGSGWRNEEIYQEARNSIYADSILFTGYVTEAEKACLYHHADAFVFPSLYEGFGMPPLEAMYWGCPVVVTNAASLPEVVGDAAELVDPFDEIEIAQGIGRILFDEAHAEELRKKGKLQAKRFMWNDSAEKLMSVCRRVLNE